MKNILNLTQHKATAEQIIAGVLGPDKETKAYIKRLLSFNEKPDWMLLQDRAELLAEIAEVYKVKYAMIGGAPYLMRYLEKELKDNGIQPLYAFTKRISKETEVDGKIVKTSEFKHLGFIRV